MRPVTAIMVMLPLVLVAAAFVLVARRGAIAADPHVDGVFWDEDIARFLRQKVGRTYVDELDEERASKAFYRAIDAYLHDLDEWSDFIPPAEHRRWKEETRGEYAGIAVKIQIVEDGLHIVGMLPDGPAAKAGIRIGDTLLSADGASLAGLDPAGDQATRLLKGAPRTPVRLRVAAGPRPEKGRAPGPVREVVAERALVVPPLVFPRRVGPDGGFGVIRIEEFSDATTDAFDRALAGLLAAGVRAIVLDLRDNGGGILPAAVHVADRFLSRGLIVRMEGRAAGANREDAAEADPKDVPDSVPVAVLVNGSTASASEVVAGALQDHRRALIVGERTYGKFLVQQVTDVPGRDAAVQLTTARYYTPSGRSYQRKPGERGSRNGAAEAEGREPAGLLPDDVLRLDDAQRLVLRKAFENEEAATWGEKPPHPDVPPGFVDPQLTRAMEILEGELVLRRIRRSTPRGG